MTKTIRLRGALSRRTSLALLTLGCVGVRPVTSRGTGKEYGPGVSDTEIKIGNTMPYSGPASSLGVNGRAAAAYYRMVNEQGGVNGRNINFISLDDGFSPPKTVEAVRRLVEQDEVLGIFGSLGSATNAATQKYLNDRKVPQFFVFAGAARFRDPKRFPWTIAADLSFIDEAAVFARYILLQKPNAKIAVLYENDDTGKDHLAGLRAGLGAEAESRIVKTASFEITDATVETQIIELKESGADVLMTAAIPKFAALAIRKMYDIGWNPLHVLPFFAATIPGTFRPAGLEASTGIVSAEYMKQPGDPAWAADQEMIAYLRFMKRYAPDLDPMDKSMVFGYYCAAAVVKVLGLCGDNLTRASLLEKTTNLQKLAVPMLLPGITMSSTPENYSLIRQMQLQRFDGTGWVKIGGIVE